MQHQKISAFTFVELIIVVIILGILGSIGFLSYTNYIAGSRDANRISQVKDIYKGLQLYSTNKLLPLPDESVTITASGSIVGYQGYAGANILQQINYTSGGKDPKDNQYFTYFVSKNKKSLQVLAFLEERGNLDKEVASHISSLRATAKNLVPNKLFSQTYAATDYSNRYPKSVGNKVGIILQGTTNIPVQDVESVQTAGELDIGITTDIYTAILSDNDTITGTGTSLKYIVKNSSCKRILQLGDSKGDGVYTINPTGGNSFDAYCDMTTDGGGWTFVFFHNNSTTGSVQYFENYVGEYTPQRTDTGVSYSIPVNLFPDTEMMVTLGDPDPITAKENNKIVFYKYPVEDTAFNKGPLPCSGPYKTQLYRIEMSGDYFAGSTQFACTTVWYPRVTTSTDMMTAMHPSYGGVMWGTGMGGTGTFGHDAWWYVR